MSFVSTQEKLHFVCGDASEILDLLNAGYEARQLQTQLAASSAQRRRKAAPRLNAPAVVEREAKREFLELPMEAGLSESALAALGKERGSGKYAEISAGKNKFDIVVFDPPPLASRRDTTSSVRRFLEDRLQKVLPLITANGLLFLSSCSAAIDQRLLLSAVRK